MSNLLEASVNLINGRLKFECTAGDNPPVITDYIPPFGDNEGYMPLQLFLISFATCSGGVIAPFLKKMGKTVTGLSMHVTGKRHEQHPTGFETIHLDIALRSPDVTEEDLQKVLQMAEDKYCPVWAMIKNNVTVTTSYVITKE
jgi:putative redox protein